MKKLGLTLFILNLLVLDGVAVYFLYRGRIEGDFTGAGVKVESTADKSIRVPTSNDCGAECQKYIDEKIALLTTNPSSTPTPARVVETPKAQTLVAKVKSISYVPVPGSGNTGNTDWTTIPGTDFYLKKSDYPGLTGIYFEVNMKLSNGNGIAFVRLYDVTHSVGVQGSEVTTSNQASTFVTSGAVSFWEGYNHYAVQAKTLTADTTVFENGRLKIVTEN